jgi:hypothetical protein
MQPQCCFCPIHSPGKTCDTKPVRLPRNPNTAGEDSKSSTRKGVEVQVLSPVLLTANELAICDALLPNRTKTHHWKDFGKNVAFAWPLQRSIYARGVFAGFAT